MTSELGASVGTPAACEVCLSEGEIRISPAEDGSFPRHQGLREGSASEALLFNDLELEVLV